MSFQDILEKAATAGLSRAVTYLVLAIIAAMVVAAVVAYVRRRIRRAIESTKQAIIGIPGQAAAAVVQTAKQSAVAAGTTAITASGQAMEAVRANALPAAERLAGATVDGVKASSQFVAETVAPATMKGVAQGYGAAKQMADSAAPVVRAAAAKVGEAVTTGSHSILSAVPGVRNVAVAALEGTAKYASSAAQSLQTSSREQPAVATGDQPPEPKKS